VLASGSAASLPSNINVISTNGAGTPGSSNAHNLSAPSTCVVSSSSATVYACTTSPTFVPADGDAIYFKANLANTGAATLNVNASSAVAMTTQGGTFTPLVANDLKVNQQSLFVFDGTHWQMQGQTGNAAAGGGVSAVSGTGPISSTGGATPAIACATCIISSTTYSNPAWITSIASSILSGALPAGNEPAHTGDMTNTAGSLATTVSRINGTALSGLATGIVKNTTGTGVPSIAIASDFPTLNQNTTGTAANITGVAAVVNGGSGVTAAQGNGTKVQLSTGTTTSNNCVKFDANGNTVDAGAACGTGGSTSPGGVATDVQINGGTFAADTGNFQEDNVSHTLTIPNVTSSGTMQSAISSAQRSNAVYQMAAYPAGVSWTSFPGAGTVYNPPTLSTGCQAVGNSTDGVTYIFVGPSPFTSLSTQSSDLVHWWPIPGSDGTTNKTPANADCAHYLALADLNARGLKVGMMHVVGVNLTNYGLCMPTDSTLPTLMYFGEASSNNNPSSSEIRATGTIPNYPRVCDAIITYPETTASPRTAAGVWNLSLIGNNNANNINSFAAHGLSNYNSHSITFQGVYVTGVYNNSFQLGPQNGFQGDNWGAGNYNAGGYEVTLRDVSLKANGRTPGSWAHVAAITPSGGSINGTYSTFTGLNSYINQPFFNKIISAVMAGTATVTGTRDQYCIVNTFNGGGTGQTGRVYLTGVNTITTGQPISLDFGAGSDGYTGAVTTANLVNGTATCSVTGQAVTANVYSSVTVNGTGATGAVACSTTPPVITGASSGSAGAYSMTSITLSGSSGCVGSAYIVANDIAPIEYGLYIASTTDGRTFNVTTSSLGTDAAIGDFAGAWVHHGPHPIQGNTCIRDSGIGDQWYGPQFDSCPGFGARIYANESRWYGGLAEMNDAQTSLAVGGYTQWFLGPSATRIEAYGLTAGSILLTGGGYHMWNVNGTLAANSSLATLLPQSTFQGMYNADSSTLTTTFFGPAITTPKLQIPLDSSTVSAATFGSGANANVYLDFATRWTPGWTSGFIVEMGAKNNYCFGTNGSSAGFGNTTADCSFWIGNAGLGLSALGAGSSTILNNAVWLTATPGSNHGIVPGNMFENQDTSVTSRTIGANCSANCVIVNGTGAVSLVTGSALITVTAGTTGFVNLYIDEAGVYQVTTPTGVTVTCVGTGATCTITALGTAQPGWIPLYQYGVNASTQFSQDVDVRTPMKSNGANRATKPNTVTFATCNNCAPAVTASSNTNTIVNITLTGNMLVGTGGGTLTGLVAGQYATFSYCAGAGGPFTAYLPTNVLGVASPFSVAANTCVNWISLSDGTNANLVSTVQSTGSGVLPGISIPASGGGTGSTFHQSANTSSALTVTDPAFSGTLVGLAGVNTFTAAGTADFSASTVADAFKVPVKAAFTAGANGSIGFDSTNLNYHGYNGADGIVPLTTGTPANNDCVKYVVASGKVTQTTAGAACGSGSGGGVPFAADTTNNGTQYTNAPSGFVLTTGAVVGMTTTAANSTGAPTLNVNGTGVKNIIICNGNGSQSLQNGDLDTLANGQVHYFAYNGTAWNLQNPKITNCTTLMTGINNGFSTNGRLTGFNGNSTGGLGLYAIHGDSNFISNHGTAAITTTTLAAWQGNTGEFWNVQCYANVHTTGTGTLTVTIGWTDGNATAKTDATMTLAMTGAAGSLARLNIPIIVGAGNITYAGSATTTGTYDLRCLAARGA
jgi:hypothetical protein